MQAAEEINLVTAVEANADVRHLEQLLTERPETDWLACVRGLVVRHRLTDAEALLGKAIIAHPDSADLRFSLAGLLQQSHQTEQAESMLREILAKCPSHLGAVFLLAHLLKDQGRMRAVADTLLAFFNRQPADVSEIIRGVELLNDCNRKHDAAAVCEIAFAAGNTDSRIYAYAAMIEVQLGNFERARQHYALVRATSPQAFEWGMATGLSSMQRYQDSGHPDFQLFGDALQRTDLSDKAREALLFAMGKAHDDIGDFSSAADYYKHANSLAYRASSWSRKHWRRGISARLSKKKFELQLDPTTAWTPIFIVGLPRSGSTVLAEWLSRHPEVCNRGELPWLPKIARSLSDHGEPTVHLFRQAAAAYEAQSRQDDTDAHWYIDKQPFNLLHVDLILALWPHARIINCQRNPRDTALSLWCQPFIDEIQDYTCNFSSIAVVIKDCQKLMAHWQSLYPKSIHSVNYEEFTANPNACMSSLINWLGLSDRGPLDVPSFAQSAISTASLWQARQPVYTRSVERWRNYADYLPELRQLPQGTSSSNG